MNVIATFASNLSLPIWIFYKVTTLFDNLELEYMLVSSEFLVGQLGRSKAHNMTCRNLTTTNYAWK